MGLGNDSSLKYFDLKVEILDTLVYVVFSISPDCFINTFRLPWSMKKGKFLILKPICKI